MSLFAGLPSRGAEKTTPDSFVLRDFIGRAWSNELVAFPASKTQLRHAQAGHALVGSDGRAALYQLTGDKDNRIQFLADIEPFATQAYRFLDTTTNLTTDLKIEESDEVIHLSNDETGIAIRKTLKNGEGPFVGFSLASDKWLGSSSFTGLTMNAWNVSIRARGPACAWVVCEGKSDKGTLVFNIRLQAHEPVVIIDDTAEIDGDASLQVTLNEGFAADHIFYRRSFQEAGHVTGKVETSPLPAKDQNPAFVLEPWLHWQKRVRQGNWFSLYNEQEPDMLTVGALSPSAWVDLKRPRETQAYPQLFLTQDAGRLVLNFPLKHGYRRWLVGTHDRAASLAVLQEKDLQRATIPQQSVIKHGNYPLDMVKDYAFTWGEKPGGHPRLLLTKDDVAAIRAAATDTNALAASVAWAIRNPVAEFGMEAFYRPYLASGDPTLGRKLALDALGSMQQNVDALVKQDSFVTLGFAPHHLRGVTMALGLADTALADEKNFLPGEIERLKAQAAFLGYTISRADYWSPERGFAANPNMTTSARGYEVALACFIPSHPAARSWAEEGLDEMRRQLDEWSDANGGWLEAPHYAMVSYDQILGAFLMARNAGFGNDVYLPKMRKVIEWFSKIATPPDSRIGGFRHLPPIGNTYLCEPSGEFGLVANLWKKKDPAFASEMQWMFLQNNAFGNPGIGGGYPGMAGYRGMMLDMSIPAKAPAWGSELFPETGAVLRNKYPSDRETYLYMIMGNNHDHYDMDSGSITFWGKGRILCDDFGYYGRAPAEDHSLVLSSVASNGGRMRPEAFQTSPAADYVRGKLGHWTREVLLVKDADPLAPNYAVLADSLDTPAPATWQLWCTAAKVTPHATRASVEGKEDVDMDVFFASPATPSLKTADKTLRSGCGMHTNWTSGAMDSTQTALQATTENGTRFLTVLFPRLKTEAAPAFTSVADGKGVQIRYATGMDYVFASREPIKFKDENVDFEGTVGVAQLRGAKPSLFLGAAGRLTAGGQTITSDKVESTKNP
jgi:hypothetical protein